MLKNAEMGRGLGEWGRSGVGVARSVTQVARNAQQAGFQLVEDVLVSEYRRMVGSGRSEAGQGPHALEGLSQQAGPKRVGIQAQDQPPGGAHQPPWNVPEGVAQPLGLGRASGPSRQRR